VPRGPLHPDRVWRGALLAAVLLSLLPARVLVGWTVETASLLTLPLVPLQHAGRLVASWLRPSLGEAYAEREAAGTLARERDEARALYRRLELDNERLRREIEMLSAATARSPGLAVRAVRASAVAATRPGPRSGAGTLKLNAGVRQGVEAGMVATRDGDTVVGRVVGDPAALSSEAVPVGGAGAIEVVLLPPEEGIELAKAPRGILKPDGRGGFMCDLGRVTAVTVGWTARLADDRWPRAAQGLRVARVTAATPLDTSPLHLRLELAPVFDPLEAVEVVLVGDADARETEP
jgi:hypothetical protein